MSAPMEQSMTNLLFASGLVAFFAGVYRRGSLRLGSAAALLFIVGALAGCNTITLTTGPTDVDAVLTAPAPSSTPPAATDSSDGSHGIYKIKVGFYGGACGPQPLAQGATTLQVACTGDMTATPKVLIDGGADRDATQPEHGPDSAVAWAASGEDVLICVTSFANGFNRSCRALKPGAWQQCATVRGIQGCASGTVQ